MQTTKGSSDPFLLAARKPAKAQHGGIKHPQRKNLRASVCLID